MKVIAAAYLPVGHAVPIHAHMPDADAFGRGNGRVRAGMASFGCQSMPTRQKYRCQAGKSAGNSPKTRHFALPCSFMPICGIRAYLTGDCMVWAGMAPIGCQSMPTSEKSRCQAGKSARISLLTENGCSARHCTRSSSRKAAHYTPAERFCQGTFAENI